jgi:zinc transport system substrate-binding protein
VTSSASARRCRRLGRWPVPLALLAAACGGERPSEAADLDVPMVVASIFPVASLARFVAGDQVRVEVLLPPRASPSNFEPTARQMAALAGADGYLFIGGGMDRWAERLLQPGDVVVRLTDGLELHQGHAHEGDSETGNPHVWLDPVLVRDHLLPRIEDVLVQAVPNQASALRARSRALADSLGALDLEIRRTLEGVASRSFVSTHSAWVYFAERYGLEEVGAVYESPGREPSARYLAALIQDARRAGVRGVFIEPQLGEAGARTVAAELGLDVHLLDPQGGQQGRGDYMELMRFNARQIALGLGGTP